MRCRTGKCFEEKLNYCSQKESEKSKRMTDHRRKACGAYNRTIQATLRVILDGPWVNGRLKKLSRCSIIPKHKSGQSDNTFLNPLTALRHCSALNLSFTQGTCQA
jgi:hypothetical protein